MSYNYIGIPAAPGCTAALVNPCYDDGPFLVHVHRTEPHPKVGSTINPIKFSHFLLKSIMKKRPGKVLKTWAETESL